MPKGRERCLPFANASFFSARAERFSHSRRGFFHNGRGGENTIGNMDLLRTSALVTAFSAAEHCLGFLYRILLSRTLGAEGLGRYQMALTVFSVLLMLSASGLPATLSRTVAAHRTRGDKRAERSAVTAALLLSFCVSLFFEALLFALRPLFAGVFSDEGAERLFYILLLGLPPTAVYAVLRGYFWGEKRFFLYSFTELSEEAVMIAAGSCLLVFCPLALAKETLAAGRRAVIAPLLLLARLRLLSCARRGVRFAQTGDKAPACLRPSPHRHARRLLAHGDARLLPLPALPYGGGGDFAGGNGGIRRRLRHGDARHAHPLRLFEFGGARARSRNFRMRRARGEGEACFSHKKGGLRRPSHRGGASAPLCRIGAGYRHFAL